MPDVTLRDYFAGLAMQVILKDIYEEGIYIGDMASAYDISVCAEYAYEMADYMIQARGKQNG